MKRVNRHATALVLALAAAIAAGCNDATSTKQEPMAASSISCTVSVSGLYTLALTGTGYYGAHPGQTLRAAVVRQTDSVRVAVCSGAIGEPLMINAGTVLDANVAYNLDYYADVNGNSACNFGVDHTWRNPIAGGFVNVTITRPHDTSFVDVCATNFAP